MITSLSRLLRAGQARSGKERTAVAAAVRAS